MNTGNLVTLFNKIRSQSEGNLPEAHKLAKAAGLEPKVVQYIALSTAWRDYDTSFRLLCQDMANDQNLAIFWRGAALESLGATNPDGQEAARLEYFRQAEELVSRLEANNDARIYVETCCRAGRAETKGQPPVSLELLRDVAHIMVDKEWFNAPGRLKSWCDALVKAKGDAEEARALVAIFAAKEASGNHSFSPRQTGFLKQAHAGLFPTA